MTLFVFAVSAMPEPAGRYCGCCSFGNQVYVGIAGFHMGILVYYGGVMSGSRCDRRVGLGAFAYLLAIPVRASLIAGVPNRSRSGRVWSVYEIWSSTIRGGTCSAIPSPRV